MVKNITKKQKIRIRRTSVKHNKIKKGGIATPLYFAAQRGDLKKVISEIKLLEKKSDIDNINYKDETALYAAAMYGHLPIVKHLVRQGADVNKARDDDSTPLITASGKKDGLNIIKFLIKNGADIDKGEKYGFTPLHTATIFGLLDNVKTLVEYGANIDKTAKNSKTPLQFALDNNKLEVAKFFIEKGAKIYPKDKEGTHRFFVEKLEDIKFNKDIGKLDKKSRLFTTMRGLIKSYLIKDKSS
jgi:ankyrin repeat protein